MLLHIAWLMLCRPDPGRTQTLAGVKVRAAMTIDSIRALLRAATPCVAVPQD
jgi:hypothetical protein